MTDAQIGDCTDPNFIRSLGVGNFDVVIVAIGDNFQSSLEATALVKEMGAKYVFARANRDIHKKFLLRNGADEVVYAEKETAERFAIRFGSKNVFDYFKINDNCAIYEISIPDAWEQKTILENNISQKYNISIIAVKKNGRFVPISDPNYRFTKEETLLVMGDNESLKDVIK